MADDSKIGVYICTDCGIGESLNIEELEKVAKNELRAPVCKTHPFLCSDEGVQVIRDDINKEGVNKIVIAACSARVNTDVFDFDQYLYVTERVNIREHVVWTQPPNTETTQAIANDNMRMGITRISKAEVPIPRTTDVERTVMVVGGGNAGLTAALEVAAAGYKAVIVEKGASLGGWATKFYKSYPVKPPFDTLLAPAIGNKVKAVEGNSSIKVHLNSTIVQTEGEPGMFDVKINKGGAEETFRVGAIIMATGWKPYDATPLAEPYGYGKFKNVVTNVEMETIALKGKITRPSDGKPANSVVFLQCAGQRDEKHVPYCSVVCCNVSLKQAKYVRESNSDAGAYIIYKDMRTPGIYENFYKATQDDPGIFLAKGEVRAITEAPDGSLLVDVDNQLLGKDMRIQADIVVLATGMVSSMIPDGMAVNDITPEYVGEIVIKKTQDGDIPELNAFPLALNLKYRQGPEMPHLKYGFPDSHFICFPYETRRTGIYAAGAVRHPMDGLQSTTDATGAALKAIQCIELTAQGKAVSPRAGDATFPDFRLESCTQCRRCTVECPFGVLDEDEKGTPKEHPYRCRRCGTCMGACPQRIISFRNYSVDMISAMLKSLDVPAEGEEPFVVTLICENDAYPAIDMAGINRMKLNPNYRFISLRCLGGTNLVWITDALSRGIDGIMLIGCKYGENYQCHFIKGSQMASERLSKVQETLGRLNLEAERVEQVQLAINEWDQLPKILEDFSEKLKGFGPNPFKGF
ncbi:hydrogenase iron-sulfur subunit [Candidatus Magnetobacterium casense]|uniref:hydrogenase iron-sulfur subunit n=1 Tax=Candidatus Magnetobacterium casense TaxID=1455061 RepID=UPI00058FAF5C|nr:hydrogenase iron-sulfur subunit [Candidatus Magnetobacterium casensis]